MLIIDKFEENYAVIEQEPGKYLNIERNKLPKNAKEGDCLILENGIYKIDEEQTKKLRSEIIRFQNSLWE